MQIWVPKIYMHFSRKIIIKNEIYMYYFSNYFNYSYFRYIKAICTFCINSYILFYNYIISETNCKSHNIKFNL